MSMTNSISELKEESIDRIWAVVNDGDCISVSNIMACVHIMIDQACELTNQELAKANHAKNEALKWYEDACKELDKLRAENEELLELLDKANETSRFWMKIAINTAEEKEKQLSELKAENEELKKEMKMSNVYIGDRQLTIKQHEANLLETEIAGLKREILELRSKQLLELDEQQVCMHLDEVWKKDFSIRSIAKTVCSTFGTKQPKKVSIENIASAIEKYAYDNCSPYEEVYDLDFNKLAKAILDCIDKD